MCGADKTFVCSESVRPVHPSRAFLACERDVNWAMSMLYESERARWGLDRVSILIHRPEEHERSMRGCPLELDNTWNFNTP